MIPADCPVPVILLGGVQINTNGGYEDFFSVRHFVLRAAGPDPAVTDIKGLLASGYEARGWSK